MQFLESEEKSKEGKKEKKKENLVKKFKKLNKKMQRVVGLACIVAILLLTVVVFWGSGKATYSVEVSLKEMLKASEVSTAAYSYRTIATVENDKGNAKYYVLYQGTVRKGFDFENIDVQTKGKTLTIVVPKIETVSVSVEPKFEYIFLKKRYDSETAYAEARKVCNKDLQQKADTNKSLNELAIKSAIETVKALAKPFEPSLSGEKTIEVVYVEDWEKEGK